MKKYKCLIEHDVRVGKETIHFEVGDIADVILDELNGDIVVGYHAANNVVFWKRVHISVLDKFEEVKAK